MAKVYITDYIDNPSIEQEILGAHLGEGVQDDAEVLLVWHEHIDKKFIDRFPKLKGIVRYGVGYDAIDVSYANSRNIFVCNTPDYGTEEVSDTAIAMIMNIARGVNRYDYLCRHYSGNWQENTLPNIRRTSDYTLGVIGAGRIGSSVLLRANALRFNTVFYDPFLVRGYEKMLGSQRVDSLEALLACADIVSLHCPLNASTRGMVDEAFVSKMKAGASFVNTARGGLISDIDVFYEGLESGKLNCVYTDVLPEEPPRDSRLINAWRARESWLDGRMLINPHTAYYSQQAYTEMRRKAAQNALRIIHGKQPFNIIIEGSN